ncbi:bifunctional glycosyltransferase family 2/GtrA family protein [Dactylosporangium vinaceum]|uniref:dolichyl-phosphate beta-glucosyltransferase n=1 Tax=Dactylosporangium vinaceum TaxID=53362 RepID=A0ABV5M4V1_9ACTN|nr:bifunctional glycosyltransferase family 2/GtrA family protein [Dactylosporangium vinaceum]UAB96043.1 bifunctional glycosyltransferase family 2/GtrA family protein [Dactylosporangium vinaceum]
MTSTETLPHAVGPGAPKAAAVLDVVIPVYNEEADLGPCVRRLHQHLRESFPYPFRITVADNASTDATPQVAEALAAELAGVEVLRLAEKGRGRALKQAWSASDAPVLAYMDVDLSTDLNALLPLVAPLLSGHSEVSIGTRLARGARVVRGPKREFISRSYNRILRTALSANFSDAQCGFKAIRKDVAEQLLPLVEDTGWFFDTELLVLAQRSGLRIHEVPVDWIDDPDSRVDIVATAVADLRGIARLGRAFVTGKVPVAALRSRLGRAPLVEGVPAGMLPQLLRFGAIGVLSTVAFLVLYALLRPQLGAQAANFVALLTTAIANTALNRRLTFAVRGGGGAVRHHLQGLLLFALGLALNSAALLALGWAAPAHSHVTELGVLILANAVTTLLRFVLMRVWVFRQHSTELS